MFPYGVDVDSQQSDEIENERDTTDDTRNFERANSEINAQDEIEEFDTDLPAEHNVISKLAVCIRRKQRYSIPIQSPLHSFDKSFI